MTGNVLPESIRDLGWRHFWRHAGPCHRTPLVYSELINYARWLLEEIGFDGFRYDMVKGYGGWMVRSIQELHALRGDSSFKPYAVGECWDSERTIDDWLDEAMRGRIIRSVRLIFRCAGVYATCATVTDSISVISLKAESNVGSPGASCDLRREP